MLKKLKKFLAYQKAVLYILIVTHLMVTAMFLKKNLVIPVLAMKNIKKNQLGVMNLIGFMTLWKILPNLNAVKRLFKVVMIFILKT
jgi:hypothetical protein